MASTALKTFLTNEDIDYQLALPYVHQCNVAECTICMFKNHVITGLCSTNANFPLHLWDCLLPQAELTLNLLCRCQCKPQLSAWAYIHRPFNLNHMPIALPSTCMLAHVKPNAHCSWAPHSMEGWYIAPAWDSY